MLFSVFTPTYNRAHLLNRLYLSLKKQNFKDFEWIIVDDGSSDNTSNVVEQFIREKKIKIIYYKQVNSGKHIAINKGVELAKGELFFIVDSDDYLPESSLEIIKSKYNLIKMKSDFAGICGRKGYSNTQLIGSNAFPDNLQCSALDLRYKYKVKGDLAEVIRTDIIKKFPFPKFNNEKFLTEGYLWYRVALQYKFLFYSDIVYIAEYQEGGLSNSIFNVRKNSPEGTILFYKELQLMPVSLIQKIRANINYWRFAKFSNRSKLSILKDVNPLYSLLGLPISLIFLIKDK